MKKFNLIGEVIIKNDEAHIRAVINENNISKFKEDLSLHFDIIDHAC